jgi:hypothetical protein
MPVRQLTRPPPSPPPRPQGRTGSQHTCMARVQGGVWARPQEGTAAHRLDGDLPSVTSQSARMDAQMLCSRDASRRTRRQWAGAWAGAAARQPPHRPERPDMRAPRRRSRRRRIHRHARPVAAATPPRASSGVKTAIRGASWGFDAEHAKKRPLEATVPSVPTPPSCFPLLAAPLVGYNLRRLGSFIFSSIRAPPAREVSTSPSTDA